MLNKAIILGYLGGDPELRYTTGGEPVTNFNVATSERWTDGNGEKKEKTEWHRIVVWGQQAESCAKYLSKGRQVLVEGKLQTRSYDKDGTTRYVTEIVAARVQFIGSGPDRKEPEAVAAPAAPSRPAAAPTKPATGKGSGKPARAQKPAQEPWDESDRPFNEV